MSPSLFLSDYFSFLWCSHFEVLSFGCWFYLPPFSPSPSLIIQSINLQISALFWF